MESQMNSDTLTEQVDAKFQEALSIHQKGDLAQAQVLYQRILAIDPRHADSLHLLGVMAHQTRNYQRAVEFIDAAVRVQPENAFFYFNRGNALFELNRMNEAVASYRTALELSPDFAEAHYSLGNALMGLKLFDQAIACYDKSIALKPEYAAVFCYNRGNALLELQQWEAAIASYDRVIAENANCAEAHSNRGKALWEMKKIDASLASYEKAIEIKPELAEAYIGRGLALHELGKLSAAIEDYREAIQLNPNSAEAHHNLGGALQGLTQPEAALASYDKAIQLNPEYAEAYCSRGNALLKLERLHEAVASYDRAILLKPDLAAAYFNRGAAHQWLRQLEKAIEDYSQALELKPDYDFVFGSVFHNMMRICDWENFDENVSRLKNGLERHEKITSPFVVLSMLDSPELQKSAAEIFAQAWRLPRDARQTIQKPARKSKIRVGYYSADFHEHATAYLMANLFESHDKSGFELFAFSFGPHREDAMRRRVFGAFDRFFDVGKMSDGGVAGLSRELGIDIAVDLKGFTEHLRPGIFAERSAPIQVNYLGYPGSLGADWYDYLIADETLIPKDDFRHYREKVVYLPNSYQVNDSKRVIANTIYRREDLGLPASGFVFCCFNSNYKITPQVFDCWMRLLEQVDGSVLWLLEDSATATRNLRKEAERRGVGAERLVFAPRMPLAEHLARHRSADLFLDTLPYNAHTTASDALWAGLPVLTRIGKSFPARVAASLLTAIQLPELITRTEAEYESLAIELATNPAKLARIREKLAKNRLTTPLFDAPLFTRHVEAAYLKIWDRYQADLPPDHIRVEGQAAP
jgi:protein O-GlcNAc transferase